MCVTIIFDNDGTLYSVPEAFQLEIEQRMISYISHKFGIPKTKASTLRQELLKRHKTESTFNALNLEYGVNYESFVQETFNAVDPGIFLKENKRLIELLAEIKDPKIILTNNPSTFARRVLKTLGIEEFFSAVYGEKEMKFHYKPLEYPFIQISLLYPGRKIFFDDKLENIKTAERLRFDSFLVSPEGDSSVKRINSIYQVSEVLR